MLKPMLNSMKANCVHMPGTWMLLLLRLTADASLRILSNQLAPLQMWYVPIMMVAL